ncbi:hypothetical protein TPA0910_17370 [Streptomyces hygroscopicus subsp. sporocinereus]|uniref:Uncharacterized protein n=1 Tax=Streptomyces hygroscopicus TaxID=1912 RepID=A0ABQ3TVD7_STRHY|nr:hypothetical protein TPA0910_17370 [Streptomyces hygroscopicus]
MDPGEMGPEVTQGKADPRDADPREADPRKADPREVDPGAVDPGRRTGGSQTLGKVHLGLGGPGGSGQAPGQAGQGRATVTGSPPDPATRRGPPTGVAGSCPRAPAARSSCPPG